MMELPEELQERYELQRELGRGGMGAVWLVRDRRFDRVAALKLLLRPDDSTLLRRFRREAESLAALRHPNVLQLYDYGLVGEEPYLVTEFLSGRSLEDGVEPADAVAALLEVASALEAVHAAGLVHRDLKPANVVLAGDGRAVLVDFGLAFRSDRTALSVTGSVSGTVGYLSPEQLRGADARPATDWYSWGATLYAVHEGQAPHRIGDMPALLAGKDRPPVFSVIDPVSGVARTVLRCLDHDPAVRPGSRAALEDLLREVPVAPSREVVQTGAGGRSGAHRELSESGVAGPRRGPWVASLGALAMAWALLATGGGPPAVPVPAQEAVIEPAAVEPVDHGAHGGLGPDFPGRVAVELEEVLTQVDPATGGDVLTMDPARWGAALSALPVTSRFHDWVAEGGRVELLGEGFRAALRGLDERFRELHLPAPFAAHLDLSPAGGRVIVPEKLADKLQLDGAEIDGWLGVAVTAYLDAEALRRDRTLELDRAWRGEETQGIPVSINEALDALREGTESRFTKQVDADSVLSSHAPADVVVERAAVSLEGRVALAEWLRVAVQRYHVFHLAAARTLEEEPERSDTVIALLNLALSRLRVLEVTHMVTLPIAARLGARPDGTAGHLAAGLVLEARARLARRYDWLDATEAEGVAWEHFRLALQASQEASDWLFTESFVRALRVLPRGEGGDLEAEVLETQHGARLGALGPPMAERCRVALEARRGG
jgi:hypothetical protein